MLTTSRLSTLLAGAALIVGGCADSGRPGGGGTVQPGFEKSGLYVANTDHGHLSRINLETKEIQTIQTGKEPTRIARVETRVYVTNRAQRSVSVFEEDGTTLKPVGTINTGAEPFGVAATADKVYVSASIEGKVFEYDASTFAETRSWAISGEPRGIALHRNGVALYVASTYGGEYSYINLVDGSVQNKQLPESIGFNFETGEEFGLARRITGDPAVSPDGKQVAIPALYVDNTSPIMDDPNGEDDARRPGGGGGGYGGRFNPAVVVVAVEPSTGEPKNEGFPVQATGFHQDPVNGVFTTVSGYPSSVTFTPDSELLLISVEGGNAVHAIDLSQANDFGVGIGGDVPPGAGAPEPGFGRGTSFAFLPITTIRTAAGPVGVAVLDSDHAFVHSLFDRRLQRIDLRAVRSVLRPDFDHGNERIATPHDPAIGVPVDPAASLRADSGFELAEELLTDDVNRGRRMFFSTGDRTMSGDGTGVSCATCHFQGRTDGLTWQFDRGPRQTPSLAGRVSNYEPVGWMGDRPTVAEDAFLTSQGLMGGQGMTHEDSLEIQAFVNFTRDIDNPLTGINDDRIVRGAEIFAREDVGCISCHAGPSYTNNEIVSMFELETAKVRPLNGIRASAPYFHDGSAATLLDVLERARDGSMGDTSSLTDLEMADLEFYLMSL